MKNYLRGFFSIAVLVIAGAASTLAAEQKAVFAGGCFWGVEAVFEHVKGGSHAATSVRHRRNTVGVAVSGG